MFPKLEAIAPFFAHRYFLKVFFTPLQYRVPEKEKEFAARAEKFLIHAANRRIQCYAWGEGPVVIVVHGWAGRATQFRRIAEAFMREGYRVIGFDGPAHGQSEGKTTNIIEFEETLKALYERTGVPEGIIAHSFGGGAVLYAAMRGLPVKRLVNIASPTIGDEIINTYLRAVHGSPSTGEFFKRWMLGKFGKPFDHFTSLWFVRHLPSKVELLLIHDEDDPEVILQHALELKKAYPDARLHATRGLGHTRILKDEQVAAHCVTFVRNGRLNAGAPQGRDT